ncbi:PREDICTED: uncharacterized protein LOC108572228 [Habropoda laboriosa]|nr:PREDICTED: uncharacterized protein LOC108572228 [Habropoda laboriosa]
MCTSRSLLPFCYSISGDNNGFEYNSNVISGGTYMPGKEGHRENTDFYAVGSSGHAVSNGRSQGNLEESLRSSSYSGFSPSSHNTGFSSYSTASRDNLATSPYYNAAQSSYDSYTSSSNNGDSSFEAYTQGSDQAGSDFSQFSTSKAKSPTYTRYSDNLPGASSTGSYPELTTDTSSFRGDYSGDSFRSQTTHTAGFVDGGDQSYNREPSNLFNSPSNDYSYGKYKDGAFGVAGSTKFMNDVYSLHPETRYVRGSHGNMGHNYGSSMLLSNSASSPFSSVRASPSPYGSGKFSKYNKYMGEYGPTASLNYLSKEQDVDYLLSQYGKGSGKLASIKDSRPSNYGGQPYVGGPSYLSKLVGGYKSKPSYISSYPSSSPVGYSSMSNLHSSFSGNSYTDGPLLRRYRSSSYVPGHGSTYSGYF